MSSLQETAQSPGAKAGQDCSPASVLQPAGMASADQGSATGSGAASGAASPPAEPAQQQEQAAGSPQGSQASGSAAAPPLSDEALAPLRQLGRQLLQGWAEALATLAKLPGVGSMRVEALAERLQELSREASPAAAAAAEASGSSAGAAGPAAEAAAAAARGSLPAPAPPVNELAGPNSNQKQAYSDPVDMFATAAKSAHLSYPELLHAFAASAEGLDGCSDSPAAVLKRSVPLPDNSWVSPHVSTLINFEPPASYPFFLYEHEATVQAPTEAEMAANEASLAENGTAWWGCASAQCVASGADVAVLDNVASAEDCCHACAERLDGTPTAIQTGQPCNAWNYCDKPDGCSFAGSSVSPAPLRLSYRQCQLRYAFLSNITYGAPLIVGAKGNASEFTCGAPLSFAAPDLPGFTRMPGRGLFLYGNYNCTPSLRPGWDCAPPSNNLTELAKGCLEDPQCLAMPIKQAQPTVNGFYNASSPYKGFRKKENAKLLIVPTTNLYIPQGRAASSSSLSAGAIVGIAVGAAAGAVVLAAAVWAAARRRRQRMAATAPTGDAAAESCKGCGLDPASSGSSHLAYKFGSAKSSSAPPSPAPGQQAEPPVLAGSRAGSPRAGAGAALPELLQRVASVEAAAAALLGASSTLSEHVLLSADSLPPRLREFLVPPSAVTYCRWPNGQPQEIGVGATSRVYRAMLNGEMVAAKEIDLASGESCQLKQEAFITEALRLQQLRHPNVVGLMGIALTPRRGVLLLEYCQGRDLHAALDVLALGTQERLFGWHRRGKRVALEVAKALNFLHSKGIVHLDVKSPNVLLTENGTAKLADVGFSREKLHTFLSDLSNFGTFAWAAPELLLARQCTQKVDIYSWGVLLWEIVTGERPQRGQLRLPRVPEECPQAASDLLLQCLHQDPAQRPTALELMQRLEPLVGPPKHALPEVGGGSGVLTTAAPAGGLMVCPSMRVAVPPAGIPSPFAALAAIALPSSQQHQLPSPFTAQAAAACASRQQQQQWGQEEERQDE